MLANQFASFTHLPTKKLATIPLKNSGKVACIVRNLKTLSKVSVMRPNQSLKLTCKPPTLLVCDCRGTNLQHVSRNRILNLKT